MGWQHQSALCQAHQDASTPKVHLRAVSALMEQWRTKKPQAEIIAAAPNAQTSHPASSKHVEKRRKTGADPLTTVKLQLLQYKLVFGLLC